MRNIEDLKAFKHGDWIFTCKLQPQQFDKFTSEKNPLDYDRAAFTDERWEIFSKYDDFMTIDGSNHSVGNCGLHKVSDAYAEWFIDNQMWLLYDDNQQFECYEARIEAVCQYFGIEFEGL